MSLISHESYRQLLMAREMLGDCYRQPVTLAEAGDSVFLSAWHFQRQFLKCFGETPHAYVTRLRITRAKELLASTDKSILEVCLEVGYSSLGSFCVLFKRQVGTSPARYRREVRRVVSVVGLRDWVCIPYCFASAFGSLD